MIRFQGERLMPAPKQTPAKTVRFASGIEHAQPIAPHEPMATIEDINLDSLSLQRTHSRDAYEEAPPEPLYRVVKSPKAPRLIREALRDIQDFFGPVFAPDRPFHEITEETEIPATDLQTIARAFSANVALKASDIHYDQKKRDFKAAQMHLPPVLQESYKPWRVTSCDYVAIPGKGEPEETPEPSKT